MHMVYMFVCESLGPVRDESLSDFVWVSGVVASRELNGSNVVAFAREDTFDVFECVLSAYNSVVVVVFVLCS